MPEQNKKSSSGYLSPYHFLFLFGLPVFPSRLKLNALATIF
jgi:hypothetical protein